MRYLLLLLLISCSSGNQAPLQQTKLKLTPTNQTSTWYELPQYFDDIPKYSGAFGTYTAKHTPIAVHHKNNTYYTYSDNSDGTLRIYVSNGVNTVEVHASTLLNDPHSNASINVDSLGYLWVHVSAKSAREKGAIYKSIRLESLEFEKIEENWEAYPQPWKLPDDYVTLHTLYERPEGKLVRQLYTRTSQCNKLLVKGGHYQVSTYQKGRVHTFYNWHPNAKVDDRTNIYYMYSINGCDWFNQNDEPITLPLEEDDERTRVYTTDRNVYLKDIEIEDGPLLLYVESDTHDPTQGLRELRIFKLGQKPEFVSFITHNYSTGYYQNGSIVSPIAGLWGYAGGNLHLIRKSGDDWLTVGIEYGHYNYARKVYKGAGGFVSHGNPSVNNGAEMFRISISELPLI